MKNVNLIIILFVLSILSCTKDVSNPKLINDSVIGFFVTESNILSQDSNFIIGSLSYDFQSDEYSVEIDSSNILDYLESLYPDAEVNNYSIRIIDNYMYLYYTFSNSSTLINYAEDVIINGTLASSIGSGGGETHECDGSCGGGNPMFLSCNSCYFDIVNGKIIGCKCRTGGFCCHKIIKTF